MHQIVNDLYLVVTTVIQQTDLSILEAIRQIRDVGQLSTRLETLTNLKKPTINRSLKRLHEKYHASFPLSLRYYKLGLSLTLSLVSINLRNYPDVLPYLDKATRIHNHRLFGGKEVWDLSFYVLPRAEIRKFNKKLNQMRSWKWIQSAFVKPIEYIQSSINFQLYDAKTETWELPAPPNQDRPSLIHLDTNTAKIEFEEMDFTLLKYFFSDITKPVHEIAREVNLKTKEIRSRLGALNTVYDIHTLIDFQHFGLDQHVLLRLDDLVSTDLYDILSFISGFPNFEVVSTLTKAGLTSLLVLLRFPSSQSAAYFDDILLVFTSQYNSQLLYFETPANSSLIPAIPFPKTNSLNNHRE